MTTPIDEMSIGQATAEILRRVRRLDERLDTLAVQPGAGGAIDREVAAIEPDLIDNPLRTYGHLRQDVARLQRHLEMIEQRLGIDPAEDLRHKLRQLDEPHGDAR